MWYGQKKCDNDISTIFLKSHDISITTYRRYDMLRAWVEAELPQASDPAQRGWSVAPECELGELQEAFEEQAGAAATGHQRQRLKLPEAEQSHRGHGQRAGAGVQLQEQQKRPQHCK